MKVRNLKYLNSEKLDPPTNNEDPATFSRFRYNWRIGKLFKEEKKPNLGKKKTAMKATS